MNDSKSDLLPFFEDERALSEYEEETETIGDIGDQTPAPLVLPENLNVNTSWSLKVKIPRTNRNASSDNPPCSSDDANCEFVEVQLQLGAQVHEVRYFMNKTSSNSDRVEERKPGEHSWAKRYPAIQYNSGGFTWVRAKYKNWRKSYDRWGQISVTWSLPT